MNKNKALIISGVLVIALITFFSIYSIAINNKKNDFQEEVLEDEIFEDDFSQIKILD